MKNNSRKSFRSYIMEKINLSEEEKNLINETKILMLTMGKYVSDRIRFTLFH